MGQFTFGIAPMSQSQDIVVGDQVYVSFGTSGVVLCNHETTHVKALGVKELKLKTSKNIVFFFEFMLVPYQDISSVPLTRRIHVRWPCMEPLLQLTWAFSPQVKFDSVLHGTGTLNVFPAQLMPQLPRSRSACGSEQRALQIGEAVVAALNLTTGEPPATGSHLGRM